MIRQQKSQGISPKALFVCADVGTALFFVYFSDCYGRAIVLSWSSAF